MKKLLVLFTLALLPLLGSAQIFGIGYNMSFANLEGMNYIVQRYNETRPFLDETMDEFHFMDGFTINFGGVMSEGVFLNLGLSKAVKKHSAEGVDVTQTLQERQLRVALVDWLVGIGIAFPLGETGSIGIGGSMNFGQYKVRTRVGEKTEVKKVDWDKIMKESMIRPSIYMSIQTSSPGICIEPYITFNTFGDVDVAPVNDAINPVTAPADPPTIIENLSMFGVRLKFGAVALRN